MLSKLLRLGEGRIVNRLKRVADYVNTLSEDIEKLTDAELRAKTDEFRARLTEGEDLDDMLLEAFAVVREAATRVLARAQLPHPHAHAMDRRERGDLIGGADQRDVGGERCGEGPGDDLGADAARIP